MRMLASRDRSGRVCNFRERHHHLPRFAFACRAIAEISHGNGPAFGRITHGHGPSTSHPTAIALLLALSRRAAVESTGIPRHLSPLEWLWRTPKGLFPLEPVWPSTTQNNRDLPFFRIEDSLGLRRPSRPSPSSSSTLLALARRRLLRRRERRLGISNHQRNSELRHAASVLPPAMPVFCIFRSWPSES